MKKFSQLVVSSFFFVFLLCQTLLAATVEEEFKIEGIISIASIKALQSELLKQLDLKQFLQMILIKIAVLHFINF